MVKDHSELVKELVNKLREINETDYYQLYVEREGKPPKAFDTNENGKMIPRDSTTAEYVEEFNTLKRWQKTFETARMFVSEWVVMNLEKNPELIGGEDYGKSLRRSISVQKGESESVESEQLAFTATSAILAAVYAAGQNEGYVDALGEDPEPAMSVDTMLNKLKMKKM